MYSDILEYHVCFFILQKVTKHILDKKQTILANKSFSYGIW